MNTELIGVNLVEILEFSHGAATFSPLNTGLQKPANIALLRDAAYSLCLHLNIACLPNLP